MGAKHAKAAAATRHASRTDGVGLSIRPGFTLDGPSRPLDLRINAARPDLADLALAGDVVAARYAEPARLRCAVGHVAMRVAPDDGATAVSELLHGEAFRAVEVGAEWCWGYSAHDRYVGYVPSAALSGDAPAPTHVVNPTDALVFAAPDIKAPVLTTLPGNARVAAAAHDDRFLAAAGGFVHRRHLRPADEPMADPVNVAAHFLGSPYRWGGRTRAGIDCSGLVQAALMACGINAPRDSDQQRTTLGRAIEGEPPRRGDLVFFPGHIGIMWDGEQLLHANAHWMAVVIEPLVHVIDRLRGGHTEVLLGIHRL